MADLNAPWKGWESTRMSEHIFIDESKSRNYLVAAAFLAADELAPTRRKMRQLLLKGQRRVHFKSESDPRRRMIIASICASDVKMTIYDASALRNELAARRACLEAIVDDAADCGAQMLVVEQDDSLVGQDRKFLYERVRKVGYSTLCYEHKRGHEDPLLWIPDAVAWCWSKGNDWKRRVHPLVTNVRQL